MKIPIGQLVRIAREKKGLTQKQLAELVDRSVSTIDRLENGRGKRINVPLLIALSKYLDEDLEKLQDGIESA